VSLSHEDVQEILRLLDESDYDELNLETERFKLRITRSQDGKGWTQEKQTSGSTQEASIAAIKPTDYREEAAPSEEGLVDIRAPIVGTFYRAPKPGADPFVDIGTTIEDGTVIAIIEVMKLMNSIPAGVSGEVIEILAEDAQFVEKGQLLMRVRPA